MFYEKRSILNYGQGFVDPPGRYKYATYDVELDQEGQKKIFKALRKPKLLKLREKLSDVGMKPPSHSEKSETIE